VVVAAWCIGVERMNRRTLDRCPREIWKRFDPKDLEEAPDAPKPRRRGK
jgi:hypothetical protein